MFQKYANFIIAIENKVSSWFPEKPWDPGTWPLNHYNLNWAQWRFFLYQCVMFPIVAIFVFVPLAMLPVLLLLSPLSGNMKALGMLVLGVLYFTFVIRQLVKAWRQERANF